MGNLSGQDTNSLLSRRLKRITGDRQTVVRKQEQPNSVVAKIERVLFAYRETLAYYQDMLEQFEEEFSSKTSHVAPEPVIVPETRQFKQMTEQLQECIKELEQQIRALEAAGASQINAFLQASNSQLSAFQEASATQLNNLEALVEQAKSIPAPPIKEEEPAESYRAPSPVSYDRPDADEMIFVDESLGMKSFEATRDYGVKNASTSIDGILNEIGELKLSVAALSEQTSQIVSALSLKTAGSGTREDDEDYLVQMEAYNKNLTDIKKRLDDLMRFVGKVDGSIIETLKSHTNGNKDAIIEQLLELKSITARSKKGIKPLLILNFILGILNIGGLAFFILYYLEIISF